jgi:hypothetical protein
MSQISDRISKLLDSSKHNSDNQMGFYQVNFIFLQGHGGIHKRDPCLIIPNNKGGTKGTVRLLNVANIAKQFAKIDKTITIIFFDACREDLDVPAH